MLRTWLFVTDCCKPIGLARSFPLGEHLIVCKHDVALRPINYLDAGFRAAWREGQRVRDDLVDLPEPE